MDSLSDDLLLEIIRRLPSSSFASTSLVSHRFLFASRSATSSLSLRLPLPPHFSLFLSHFPFLTHLTLSQSPHLQTSDPNLLLPLLANSPSALRLSHLRLLLPDSPISSPSLFAFSLSFKNLNSLQISILLPSSFRWLLSLPLLTSLSLIRSRPKFSTNTNMEESRPENDDVDDFIAHLRLEHLCLSGIRAGDTGLSWIFRRSGNLRQLQLRACEGTGDCELGSYFINCLQNLLSLELRTCRTIADRVLVLAAEHCHSLTSLLLYDGGSRDALRHFISHRGAALRTIDLRLPLDLHNDHLIAIAAHDRRQSGSSSSYGHNLEVLRLQSCCLVTGDGLRSIAQAPVGATIEELALVSCDVVEREHGLLTFLVQNMLRLRRLDLSHNEALSDKELGSMLASCSGLVEIRLRGCGALTGATLGSLVKYCSRRLDLVDISGCPGISIEDIESLALKTASLRQIIVEEWKVSEVVKNWMSKNRK